MTDRLYYDDPYVREFDATVLRAEPYDGGTAVWLDRTAFYPTSGGQPFDLGTIEGRRIVLVEEDEAGAIVHRVEGVPLAPGAAVHGRIDWNRRFDHMQQHTGQHVLSAVMARAGEARTVSFHLGSEASTIDLDRELSAAQIAQSEHDANRLVWDDRLVTIRYATEEDARRLPLRKESTRTGTLRLIDIDGVDLSACGGTHVARTGAIGQIAITSWERFKGGQRVEFVCGGRALTRFQQLRETAAASMRLLSVLPGELPSAIGRLQAESKEQQRALTALHLELASCQAVALAESAEPLEDGRLVLRVVDGDANRLKMLAAAAAARPGILVLLISRAVPSLAVAARASDLSVSCSDLIAALAKQFGGRGGGRSDLAQCGGLDGSPEEILAFARTIIR